MLSSCAIHGTWCTGHMGTQRSLWGHSGVRCAPLIGAVPPQEGTAPEGAAHRSYMVE